LHAIGIKGPRHKIIHRRLSKSCETSSLVSIHTFHISISEVFNFRSIAITDSTIILTKYFEDENRNEIYPHISIMNVSFLTISLALI